MDVLGGEGVGGISSIILDSLMLMKSTQFCFIEEIIQLWYRSGTVNLKSFVGKVLLQIKWKFELN